MKCYNCGKPEELIGDEGSRFSDIDRIETEVIVYSNEEEKYMPLCQKCLKEWESGRLADIEQKWVAEKNKSDYISLSPLE